MRDLTAYMRDRLAFKGACQPQHLELLDRQVQVKCCLLEVGHVRGWHNFTVQGLEPYLSSCSLHLLQRQLNGELPLWQVGVCICPVVQQRPQVDPQATLLQQPSKDDP